jgi:hypothetical protein
MPDDPKQRRTIFAKAAPPQFEVRFKSMFGESWSMCSTSLPAGYPMPGLR